jgi:hypothetical protein
MANAATKDARAVCAHNFGERPWPLVWLPSHELFDFTETLRQKPRSMVWPDFQRGGYGFAQQPIGRRRQNTRGEMLYYGVIIRKHSPIMVPRS